jgi:hypothetical protein
MSVLKHAEREALAAMADKPLEIWTESMEAACAVLVCDGMAKRGLCVHERANATLARFTITDAGRRALAH